MKKKLSSIIALFLFGFLTTILFDSCVALVYFDVPNSANAGQTIPAKIRIKTDGTESDYRVFFYLSEDKLLSDKDVFLTSISGNNIVFESYKAHEVYFQIPNNTLTGDYYVIAVATGDGYTIYEGGENIYYEKISINGINSNLPDLSVNNLFLAYEEVYSSSMINNNSHYKARKFLPGDKMKVSLTLENRSNGFAGNTSMRVYLSQDVVFSSGNDILVSTQNFSPVQSQDREEKGFEITMPSVAQPGNYYLLFIPDYWNQVSEYNENNLVYVRFSVPSQELVLEKVDASIFIQTGDNITTTGTIRNGNFLSNPNANFSRIYLSEDDKLNTADDPLIHNISVPAIGVGGNLTYDFNEQVYIPDDVETGVYYLIYRVQNSTKSLRVFIYNPFGLAEEDICEVVTNTPKGNISESVFENSDNLMEEESFENNPDGFNFEIYPNPTSDFVKCDFEIMEDGGDGEVTIFDNSGKELTSIYLPNLSKGTFSHEFNVSRLPKGIYTISIYVNGEKRSKQLVVQ